MSEKLNFLVPVDFDSESESDLQYAVSVGRDLKAVLHLVHILEKESSLLKLIIDKKQREMIKRGANDKLVELAGKIISPSGIKFTTTIMQGKINDKIIEASRKTGADLVFMGRTDSSDLRKNIVGTNTMQIIKEADVPVITLRKKPDYPGCSHIILPLDLTKQTVKKASNAVRIAKMLKAGITVVSFFPKDRKSIEIQFIQRLDKIRQVFEKLDVQCEVKLVPSSGESWYRQLNRTVKELKGEAVMIMIQQEMNITDFFIGSHAQEIINKFYYRVLSINPISCEEQGIPDSLASVFINPIQMLDH